MVFTIAIEKTEKILGKWNEVYAFNIIRTWGFVYLKRLAAGSYRSRRYIFLLKQFLSTYMQIYAKYNVYIMNITKL